MRRVLFIVSLFIISNAFSLVFAQDVEESTIQQQKAVEVTIYNNNLGLVKDTRAIKLPNTQQGELKFKDVASAIMPVTVSVKSLNFTDKFTVLEQNYEYDLMSRSKLLDKYVGKDIKLLDYNEFKDKKDVIDATLLSNNDGQIYKIGEEIYLGHPGIQILPKIPENLIAKPTLTWLYRNLTDKEQQLQVSYLTQNISWQADYVMLVNKEDNLGDLSGWVTINNNSGTSYKNAQLKLVAGEVNQVEETRGGRFKSMDVCYESAPGQQFQEQAFFEYHIYDLQRKTDIKDNQTKQISLLEARGVKLNKEFIIDKPVRFYFYEPTQIVEKQPVNVYLVFKNAQDNKLGMPLPKGVMRLYKEDSKASLQFIGEDRIEHTPKDEEVRLKIGQAFDVVAERRQVEFQRITNDVYETEWEITIRNHKKEEINIAIIEGIERDWQIISKSQDYEKLNANTIKFTIKIPAEGKGKIVYRVRIKH